MSELSELRDSVNKLTLVVEKHIAQTEEYREQRDQAWKALTTSYWGKDGNAGLETKVDRLVQNDARRTWAFKAVVTGLIGLLLERFVSLFQHFKHQ